MAVKRLLDWIMPLGPWKRLTYGRGYPFMFDTIRWLSVRGGEPEPYEIDSMSYIFESLDAA